MTKQTRHHQFTKTTMVAALAVWHDATGICHKPDAATPRPAAEPLDGRTSRRRARPPPCNSAPPISRCFHKSLSLAFIANMAKKKGFRSVNDGKAWRCRCGVVNQPTKHRFFNLPAFQCSQCQRKVEILSNSPLLVLI